MKKTFAALATVALVALGLAVAPSAAFAAGGSLTGFFSDTSQVPINNAVVEFQQDGGVNYYYTDATGHLSGGTVPVGTYTVFIHAVGFSPEYFNDSYTVAGATSVTVTDGVPVVINAELSTGSTISGVITDWQGSAAEAQVFAFAENNPDAEPVRGLTDPNTGAYSISSLAPGDYKVWISTDDDDDNVDQWYNGQYLKESATLVHLGAPGSTATVSVQLAKGGSVAGTVTNTIGSPIYTLEVLAAGPLGSSGEGGPDYDGNYVIPGLLTDTYTASIHDYSGFFQDATKTGLSVTPGSTATANLVLTPALVDESEFYPRPALSGPTSVQTGKTYTWTVDVGGDSDVYAILYSSPVFLGAAVQNDDGTATLTLTIPASTPAGTHKLTYSSYYDDIGGASRDYFDISVTAAATTALPATGVDSAPVLLGGTLLLAVGAGVLLIRRRFAA